MRDNAWLGDFVLAKMGSLVGDICGAAAGLQAHRLGVLWDAHTQTLGRETETLIAQQVLVIREYQKACEKVDLLCRKLNTDIAKDDSMNGFCPVTRADFICGVLTASILEGQTL